MRKWKDDGSHMIPIKRRRMLLFLGYSGIILGSMNIFLFHNINIFNIVSIPMSIFFIYSVQFNGMYKIVRLIAEYKLRRKDNKFDYRSWR